MNERKAGPAFDDSSAGSRSVCYRFLAQTMLFDPSPPQLEGIRSIDTSDWPGEAGHRGPGSDLVAGGLEEMREAVVPIDGSSLEGLSLELSRQRTRLFRGISPGYGAPPPYEALHRARGGEPEMQTLLEVQKLFAEAGVELGERMDRPDYLGLELDLMGFLCEEESRLRRCDDDEGAGRAVALQNQLLRDHLLRWVPSYCGLLRREAGAGFYAGMSKVLEGFLDEEAARLSTDQNTLLDL